MIKLVTPTQVREQIVLFILLLRGGVKLNIYTPALPSSHSSLNWLPFPFPIKGSLWYLPADVTGKELDNPLLTLLPQLLWYLPTDMTGKELNQ
jgi:hypothetical protein